MKEKDIAILFSRIAEDSANYDDSVKDVFSRLIKTTLKYRDHILKSKEVIITVEDVRSSLDWLIPSLKTGRLPETDDKVKLDLLKLWLDELRTVF